MRWGTNENCVIRVALGEMGEGTVNQGRIGGPMTNQGRRWMGDQ